MPLMLPAAAMRRAFTPNSSRHASKDAPSHINSRLTTKSISPPLMGHTASTNTQGSSGSVLLGNCAVQRRKMVLQHGWGGIDEDARSLQDFYDVDESVVGCGGFGTVRKARLRDAPTVVRAVKAVLKRNLKAQNFVRGEIAILRRLDHPCICRLLETFEDAKAIYLVLEFIDGSELFDEIVESGCLVEAQASIIMRQVFNALQYCHARNVIHRDLKPDNIMVQRYQGSSENVLSAPEVKLIDFGLAVISSRVIHGRTGSSVVGSSDYLSPEARNGSCCRASDVWSAGMVLHAILVGRLPNWNSLGEEVTLDFSDPDYTNISVAAKDLLCGLLKADPEERMDSSSASNHIWIQGLDVSCKSPQRDIMHTLTSIVSFHRSAKLRRAALTALAMQLTNKQLQGLREQFLQMDTDGNGRISKEELAMSIAMSAPGGGAAEDVRSFVESVFDSLDTDGSQEIDYTEWLAAALEESLFQSDEALRAAFRIFDTDGDGSIDHHELGRVLAQTPEEIKHCLPEFDANGDGVIDFEEFKGIFLRGELGQVDITPGIHKLSL
jgi:calcium-dependent protein kinase